MNSKETKQGAPSSFSDVWDQVHESIVGAVFTAALMVRGGMQGVSHDMPQYLPLLEKELREMGFVVTLSPVTLDGMRELMLNHIVPVMIFGRTMPAATVQQAMLDRIRVEGLRLGLLIDIDCALMAEGMIRVLNPEFSASSMRCCDEKQIASPSPIGSG